MTVAAGSAADERWRLALVAAELLGATPNLGGILVRARPGPVRDAFAAALGTTRRLPASADAEALDGGLDLAATLSNGRPVMRAGLLAELGGTILVVPMAERLPPALAARLAAALDTTPLRLVLFDESEVGSDEHVGPALADRLAIHIDLSDIRLPMADLLADRPPTALRRIPGIAEAPALNPGSALATAAATLGIASIRAPLQALRVAHGLAKADRRNSITGADLETAAALVLGPRATRVPSDAPPEQPDQPSPPTGADNSNDDPPDATPPAPETARPEEQDLVLDAAQTTLPPGLLDALANGVMIKSPGGGASGARLRSLTSGRPAGVRAGAPGRGARLALIDTIKAAAPWQALRARPDSKRLNIRHDDLRIRRFVARAQSTTIFAVDASGSAAFARLSEAKGAVELLLAQAYVKRAEVALVAFRGETAEISLPPTRSLARAKRQLAALAGGGGTPMAAGIDLARRVAEAERSRGRTPLVVLLTDGRANVGATATFTPHEAALASARVLGGSGIASVFIDCSARPRPEGGQIATAMAARYVALPRMDAQAVVAAVQAASK
jgi:magnesium chelatase subunit D